MRLNTEFMAEGAIAAIVGCIAVHLFLRIWLDRIGAAIARLRA